VVFLQTWSEASDRLIYVANNMRQVDTGNSLFFGNISAVFRTGKIRDNVLIAPVDTGIWEGSCNGSQGPDLPINCSAWTDLSVATLNDHNHLLLNNLYVWAQTQNFSIFEEAFQLFSRSAISKGGYADIPPISDSTLTHYYESNIIGNPRFPAAVKFLVASFTSLYGSSAGRKAQKLADHYRWPVVWALGGGYTEYAKRETLYPGNQRILDPSTISVKSLNVSISADIVEAFTNMWSRVAEERAHGVPTTATVNTWWGKLAQTQTHLAPVSSFSCAALDDCIGVVLETDDCVCLL